VMRSRRRRQDGRSSRCLCSHASSARCSQHNRAENRFKKLRRLCLNIELVTGVVEPGEVPGPELPWTYKYPQTSVLITSMDLILLLFGPFVWGYPLKIEPQSSITV
jgi:hypothetical protein